MKNAKQHPGFSTVELLITLFIAAAFLMSGYQLYSLIMKEGGEARAQAKASNVAYDYLQRYKTSATNPCTEQTPVNAETINVDGLSDAVVTVAISCPYSASLSVSKIQVTVQYGNPQKTVINATYVKP